MLRSQTRDVSDSAGLQDRDRSRTSHDWPTQGSVLGILFHKKNSYGIRDIISIIQNGIRDIIPGIFY
jgi:hypothetical protein